MSAVERGIREGFFLNEKIIEKWEISREKGMKLLQSLANHVRSLTFVFKCYIDN